MTAADGPADTGKQYVEPAKGCQPEWSKLVNSLLDALLPMHCVVCGLPCGHAGLCAPCRNELPWIGVACKHCGLPLPGADQEICGPCLLRPPPQDRVCSPMRYSFPVRELVQKFKFGRDMAVGKALGRLLSDSLAAQPALRPDLIVPVPLHRYRLFARGFNQAYLLARHVARRLGLPLCGGDLRRIRVTVSQSGLDAPSRQRNLRGAFRWHGGSLAGKRVALVDDVMTTGATIHACVATLRSAGAEKVDAWVLARAVKSP